MRLRLVLQVGQDIVVLPWRRAWLWFTVIALEDGEDICDSIRAYRVMRRLSVWRVRLLRRAGFKMPRETDTEVL